jgi:hypothetical protein
MAVSNTYSAKEIKKLMLLSFKKYQNGTISETQAYRENTMLANILRAIEASEQEARLEALEQAILKTKEE